MPPVAPVAAREEGWTRVLLGTAAFLLLVRAPGARALLPVVDTLYLLLPVLTACFVAGWAAGGSGSVAAAWVLLTAALLLPDLPAGRGAYHDIARGWGLLVGAAFGAVCVAGATGPLLRRAFAAAGLAAAAGIALGGALLTDLPALSRVFASEFAARNAASEAAMARWMPAVSAKLPAAAEWAAAKMAALSAWSAGIAAPLAPALLVAESVAACALAWSLYHRLSRVRLGPPLGALRRFTFGQAPAWALVGGGALLLLPVARAGSAALLGVNVVALSAALFALRGAAVAAWYLPVRRTAAQAAAWAAGLALAPVTAPAALALGVTDGWLDWRGLARAQRPATPAPSN